MTRPIILLSNPHMQSLTFFWPGKTRYWVGYRVLESSPDTHLQASSEESGWPAADWGLFPDPGGDPLSINDLDLPKKHWRTAYREKDLRDNVQLVFQADQDGSAWCSFLERDGQQRRELFFRPDEDGVQMWMRLSTQTPIDGAYLVQQCLRFTGAQNWSMRRQIACVPFLSELDVQAMGHPDLTLTYARQGDKWLSFSASHILYATPLGSRGSGKEFNGTVDSGLIIRETLDRKKVPRSYFRKTAPGQVWERISSGMYWERTA